MTLIIMLILAGISLSGLIGGKGLFQRTEDASNIYNEKKAREVLETVLLTDGQYEKNTNPKYNQDDFLDDLIKKEIPGSDVKGDVAIIGDYAYDLDRSVPKIGKGGDNGYLGNPKDLIWPEVVIVSGPTLVENGRKSKFKIRATIDEKATKGITRIELWLNGKKLNQDREYTNEQREVEEEYIVNRNGIYTIKAYANLMGSGRAIVEGIVLEIEISNQRVVQNSDGTGIPLEKESKYPRHAPLYIAFESSINGGITSVDKEIPYAVNKNGIYKFKVTGTVDEITIEKEVKVIVDQFKIPTLEVGAYVKYDVSYTDVWTGYEFTEKDGWRILDLGTKNADGTYSGTKIVSTGLPCAIWSGFERS